MKLHTLIFGFILFFIGLLRLGNAYDFVYIPTRNAQADNFEFLAYAVNKTEIETNSKSSISQPKEPTASDPKKAYRPRFPFSPETNNPLRDGIQLATFKIFKNNTFEVVYPNKTRELNQYNGKKDLNRAVKVKANKILVDEGMKDQLFDLGEREEVNEINSNKIDGKERSVKGNLERMVAHKSTQMNHSNQKVIPAIKD